jgi:hypothetical protein
MPQNISSSQPDDEQRRSREVIPPQNWSLEPVADFGFFLNRELPTYEDDNEPDEGGPVGSERDSA